MGDFKQNFKNIKKQYTQNDSFTKITSRNIFLFWISSLKQNFKNFKSNNFRDVQILQFKAWGFVVSLCKKNRYPFSAQAYQKKSYIRTKTATLKKQRNVMI